MSATKPLLEVIYEQMQTDDEPMHKQDYWIRKAVREGDCDALLIAICGWSFGSLERMAEGKEVE